MTGLINDERRSLGMPPLDTASGFASLAAGTSTPRFDP
jgi:hypothetical protein